MASSKDVATMMILLGFLSMALCYEGSLAVKRKAKQPNIVFILTDDQDVALFGQYPMPKTKKLIADVGMTFTNMFVTSPLCCPSRSSILSGRFLHNHMTTNNSLSGNCSSTAWQNSAEKKAFPTFLQANGYRTFFAGKYLNEYGSPEVGGVEHIPPGWDVWNGLVGNSVYYNYTLSADGKAEKHGDNYSVDYLTDVIHHKALKFLTTRTSKQPFFMMLSTPACHSPFKSAPQYMVNFTNEKAPRNKQFNIHAQDKHWLIQQAVTPMPNDTIDMIDGFFRNRWRTLLSVDDMVEGVINKLTDIGELDNTYIFFSSDNGYHLGQFSLPFDKRQFYDFDIRVPLMVRGPGIKANTTCQDLIMSVDFAPTFLNISGSSQSVVENFDGMSFLSLLTHSSPLSSNTSPRPSISRSFISETKFSPPSLFSAQFSFGDESFRDAILVEYVGEHLNRVPHCPRYRNQGLANCDNHCVCEDAWNNTYGCIRYETQQESYKYCALQDNDNFVEVYDLKADPYELNNIAKTASPDLLTKLSQDLADLSLCSGSTCHKKSPYPSH
ncbi:N-acetylglucosamine-6-sulfatase-like isoform X1 [Physella acuta]|uniref:N-acetylglucosamine-6-sulfatase-like isoform X1 n=1 Tax=Physella acuta TaxID=109671 RepID=UPI0027DC00E9|nr:N-acetylglucosamine-6-sulfatase-like isoform X1 [Physella acuta]